MRSEPCGYEIRTVAVSDQDGSGVRQGRLGYEVRTVEV